MAAIFSAMLVAWASDSITQGPAIRKSGAFGPNWMLAIEKLLGGGMCGRMVAGTGYAGMGGISTLNCVGENRVPQRRRQKREHQHRGKPEDAESDEDQLLIRGGFGCGHA